MFSYIATPTIPNVSKEVHCPIFDYLSPENLVLRIDAEFLMPVVIATLNPSGAWC